MKAKVFLTLLKILNKTFFNNYLNHNCLYEYNFFMKIYLNNLYLKTDKAVCILINCNLL